jgi:hypothetical protein
MAFREAQKWIVGHIRALEERMGNVERWPAKKVNEKGGDGRLTCHPPWRKLNEMRDKLVEMQGRISEPGREMAKFTTSSGMLSTMLLRAQTNSSFAIHADELLNNRPLPFSPTKYTRGLSSGDLRRCKSVSPPLIPLRSAPNNHNHAAILNWRWTQHRALHFRHAPVYTQERLAVSQ